MQSNTLAPEKLLILFYKHRFCALLKEHWSCATQRADLNQEREAGSESYLYSS